MLKKKRIISSVLALIMSCSFINGTSIIFADESNNNQNFESQYYENEGVELSDDNQRREYEINTDLEDVSYSEDFDNNDDNLELISEDIQLYDSDNDEVIFDISKDNISIESNQDNPSLVKVTGYSTNGAYIEKLVSKTSNIIITGGSEDNMSGNYVNYNNSFRGCLIFKDAYLNSDLDGNNIIIESGSFTNRIYCSVIVNGGEITGNISSFNDITINGGIIHGNIKLFHDSGSSATLFIYGGRIIGNIYLSDNSYRYDDGHGYLIMDSGYICGNVYGGSMDEAPYGNISISNSTLEGNISSGYSYHNSLVSGTPISVENCKIYGNIESMGNIVNVKSSQIQGDLLIGSSAYENTTHFVPSNLLAENLYLKGNLISLNSSNINLNITTIDGDLEFKDDVRSQHGYYVWPNKGTLTVDNSCISGTVNRIAHNKNNDEVYKTSIKLPLTEGENVKCKVNDSEWNTVVDESGYIYPYLKVDDEIEVSNDQLLYKDKISYIVNENNTASVKRCDESKRGTALICNSIVLNDTNYTVTSIDQCAFDNCSFVKEIQVDNDNEAYSSENGVLYNKNKTTLVKYPEGKTDIEFKLPDTITDINNNAMINCNNLKISWMPIEKYELLQAKLPSEISGANNLYGDKSYRRGDSAEALKVKSSNVKWFVKNENGEVNEVNESNIVNENGYSIYTPSTDERGILEYYAEVAIDNNTYRSPSVKVETYCDITAGEDEDIISDSSGNSEVGGLTISDESNNTDEDTGNITNVNRDITGDVTIPGRIKVDGRYIDITKIDAQAFAECENMKVVEIPSTIEDIDNTAFMGCTSLEKIKVSPDNPYYCSVDGVLYNKDKTKIIVYPGGKTDESYTILNSVTEIDDNAFYGASYIKSIDMSDNVTSIGSNAFTECINLQYIRLSDGITKLKKVIFSNCISLESITIPSNVVSIGSKVFMGCTALKTAKVPNGTSVNSRAFYRCSPNLNIIRY